MPRTAPEPLTKISANIYANDAEWLRAKFGQQKTGDGYGDVIRMLVRQFRRKCQREEDSLAADAEEEVQF